MTTNWGSMPPPFIDEMRDAIMASAIESSMPNSVCELPITPSIDHDAELGIDPDISIDFKTFPLPRDLPSKVEKSTEIAEKSKDLLRKLWSGGEDGSMTAMIWQGMYNQKPALRFLAMLDGEDIVEELWFNKDTSFKLFPVERWSTVPEDVRDIVANRCIHWIVRQHCSKITCYDVRIIFKALYEQYKSFRVTQIFPKSHCDLYDVLILLAKIELKKDISEETADDEIRRRYHIFLLPYPYLLMIRKPQVVLKYVLQLCDFFQLHSDLNIAAFKIKSAFLAASLFLQLKDWISSEKYYVTALHFYVQHLALRAEAEGIASETAPTLFDPNEPSIHQTLSCFIHCVYWSWPNLVKPWDVGNGTEATLSVETDVFLTLQSLLVQAGWNTADEYEWGRACSIDVYTLPRRFLKEEYRIACKAKGKIVEALQTDDVRLFREQIQSAKLPNATVDFNHPGDEFVEVILRTPIVPPKSDYQRIHHKKHCAECLTLDAKNCCPCGTVSYCSRECQAAHWKVHKRVCPNRSSN